MPSSTLCPSPSPPVAGAGGASCRREGEELETLDVLPVELWTEILVRLPVQSLLTLKSVSKTFLSLIQNPNFASLHFSNNQSSCSQLKGSDLLLLERPADDPFSINCDFFLAHRSYTPMAATEFSYLIHRGGSCGVVGYVNGLLWLCRSKAESTEMILCNPSIRKGLVVPPSPSSHLGWSKLGFGYDPVSNDYKGVSIVYVDDGVGASPCPLVEIYSLRAESWRSIGFDVLYRGWFLERYVYLNGVLHWIAGFDEDFVGPDDYYLSHLISFDLGTEVFSFTGLPDFGMDDGPIKLLVLFHGSVAVFCITAYNILIWVMKEGDWRKEWSIASVPMLYNYVLDETSRITSVIFSEESNELLVAGFNGMISFNIETRQFKFRNLFVTYVDKYVDSMLWRESMTHWSPLRGAVIRQSMDP